MKVRFIFQKHSGNTIWNWKYRFFSAITRYIYWLKIFFNLMHTYPYNCMNCVKTPTSTYLSNWSTVQHQIASNREFDVFPSRILDRGVALASYYVVRSTRYFKLIDEPIMAVSTTFTQLFRGSIIIIEYSIFELLLKFALNCTQTPSKFVKVKLSERD